MCHISVISALFLLLFLKVTGAASITDAQVGSLPLSGPGMASPDLQVQTLKHPGKPGLSMPRTWDRGPDQGQLQGTQQSSSAGSSDPTQSPRVSGAVCCGPGDKQQGRRKAGYLLRQSPRQQPSAPVRCQVTEAAPLISPKCSIDCSDEHRKAWH